MLSLIYVSNSARLLSFEEIQQILIGACERNQQAGITGILLYADGNFMQYLEGPHAAVEATFDRIKNNPAHNSIIELLRQEITSREFKDSSMAYWSPTFRQLTAGNSKEVELDPDLAFHTIRNAKIRALLSDFHNRTRLDKLPPLRRYSRPAHPLAA